MKKYYLPTSGINKINVGESLEDVGFYRSKKDTLSKIADEIYDAKSEGVDDLVHGYLVVTVKKVINVATTKPDGELNRVKYLSRKRKKFRLKKGGK